MTRSKPATRAPKPVRVLTWLWHSGARLNEPIIPLTLGHDLVAAGYAPNDRVEVIIRPAPKPARRKRHG